jgi:hypothetical protein
MLSVAGVLCVIGGVIVHQAVTVEVVAGDVLSVDADVLALKYAQAFHGVDNQVAGRLGARGRDDITPQAGGFRLVPSEGVIAARRVLFVGVVELYDFRYREIREFGTRVLSSLAGEASATHKLALTLHGPGYGLDERECFLSEVAGLVDGITSGDYPAWLEAVQIVEKDQGRAKRLRALLDSHLPGGLIDPDTRTLRRRIGGDRSEELRAMGYSSGQKPHIFVAMSFAAEMWDLFHFGIYLPVSSMGRLCERVDLTPAVGGVLERIKDQIKSAEFVVAELTGAKPNVLLEVGYAWGCGVPTLLLVRSDETQGIPFDLKGQRYIAYTGIHDLEKKLSSELAGLLRPGLRGREVPHRA